MKHLQLSAPVLHVLRRSTFTSDGLTLPADRLEARVETLEREHPASH